MPVPSEHISSAHARLAVLFHTKRVAKAGGSALASDHSLQSVMVGLAAPEAGLVFPQLIDFIESALRVEDVVFRMTRDRAVVFLADVDLARAKQILDRLLADFCAQVALVQMPALDLGFYEVTPGTRELSVKEVLPELFR